MEHTDPRCSRELAEDGGAAPTIASADKGSPQSIRPLAIAVAANAGTWKTCAPSQQPQNLWPEIDRGLRRLEATEGDVLRDAIACAGTIRAWGVSKVRQMEDLFDVPQGDRCATNELLYNLDYRSIGHDLLPWCEQHGMPVMAYSPFGGPGANLLRDPTLARTGARSLGGRRCAHRDHPQR